MRVFFKSILVLIFFAGAACARSDGLDAAKRVVVESLVIQSENGDHKFNVELADNDDERRLGLMYRTELAPDAGMLFDFDQVQPVSMWMKNTLIPLDMAFIDEKGVIKRIAADTTPRSLETIPSGEPVLAVLEVNGGTFARLGVKPGDTVRHPMFHSK